MDGSAAPFVDAIDQAGIVQLVRAAPLHQGSQDGARRAGPRLLRAAPRRPRLPPRSRDRFRRTADRPPEEGRSTSIPQRSAANSPAPAPSASCATSSGSGRPASRSAPRSKTPSRSTTTRILNPEGLRYADEFVRHKMLDAVGDLALAGAPIIGAYRSYCGGHRMNVAVLAGAVRRPTRLRHRRGAVPPSAAGRAEPSRRGRLRARPQLSPRRS